MPGVWGIVSEETLKDEMDLYNAFHKEKCTSYLKDYVNYDNSAFGRCSIDKFRNDKIFEERYGTLICTDGIILNSNKLLSETKSSDLFELLLDLYNHHSDCFLKNFRGNFSGFLYFKLPNKLVLFTDHLAAKPIYYYFNESSKMLVFASNLKVVIDKIKSLKVEMHLDYDAARCLLTFGYMLGDSTLVSEIKKLPPGHVLVYEGGKIRLSKYYKLSSTPYIDENESSIIKNLDKLFSDAVRLEYEKDLEYNYQHISTLSGGLDSRMNVAYAKKLNFDNINCFTFSESGYEDEMIAKKISSDYHFDFIFYSLDNGDYLLNYIDDIVLSNDGLVFYSGSAHLYACLKKLSLCEYGLVHTGQIGDLILGSYLKNKFHSKFNSNMVKKIAYSTKLIEKLKSPIDNMSSDYENDEICSFYERCINGVFNGYRMIEQFTEFSSPFLYIDFLDYAMKIPPSYRYKESIYIKWIKKFAPEFSNYKWEKYGLAPRYPVRLMECYKMSKNLIKRLHPVYHQKNSSMNPFDYWWKSNESLRDDMTTLFRENLDAFDGHPELLNDSVYLFNNGNLLEKTQVITLERAIKLMNI